MLPRKGAFTEQCTWNPVPSVHLHASTASLMFTKNPNQSHIKSKKQTNKQTIYPLKPITSYISPDFLQVQWSCFATPSPPTPTLKLSLP
jgi:hypothetical protein